MRKTIGLDLGTNSIGLSIRDIERGSNIIAQLEYFNSVIFKSGVGKEKNAEFSFAAKRTEKRSTRRLYQARKYRIWTTLKLLIENDYCPLTMEDLEKWSKYDKAKGLKRQYPIHATKFEQWVRLDFDGDGVADYSSPFQLRAELMEKQFDFSNQIDRYKLGRALYHIAQRRGFKSSKGETIKEQEKNEYADNIETDISDALKKSEEKKSGKLSKYMELNNLPTVGCAFYHLEKNGIRVRNSEYQAVRSQYKDEIKQIFEFQKGLDKESGFYKRLVSEKKGEGTIFYKRPLRSQKGTVGNCTLEPNKPRCPISHPEFEKFRAWCLINNIRFGEEQKELSNEQKEHLYNDVFLKGRIDKNGIFRIDSSFKFQKIRVWIEKQIGKKLDYEEKTINYKDNTTISGCPISGRLKNLFGDNWENWKYSSGKEKRIIKKKGDETVCKTKVMEYYANDLWHVCFYCSTFDDSPDFVKEFAVNKLQFDDNQTDQLIHIYDEIQQGYAMLSLKAIKNINRFLKKGLIYTDAVLLAKLPDIFKDKWEDAEESVIAEIDRIVKDNRDKKQLYNIANTLIANYKSLEITEQFANKDFDYKLDSTDLKDVREITIKAIGEKTWAKKSEEEQHQLLEDVADLYQNFFASERRDYYKLPKVADALADYLHEKYEFLSEKELRKIYHPSMIEFYAKAKYTRIEDGRSLRLLGSPVIGALKNPMAMRVLHTLRIQLNKLIKEKDKYGNALIDEDTRVVVETAKELNDANKRWAIREYQEEKKREDDEFETAIKELIQDSDFKGSADSQNKNDIDKLRLWFELSNSETVSKLDSKGKPICVRDEDWKTFGKITNQLLFDVYNCKNDAKKKYRLWKEQNFRCLYTGRPISLSQLFSPNCIDFEHTIPRSLSFDDSMANLTVCDAHYNRTVKQNRIPTQLANYEQDANGYKAILPRLQPWFDKVEQLKDNVDFWKVQSKRAQTKERKDHCIQQKHLWQMELDYWQNKVDRFTMTEVTSGFRNNQLNDTRIITKYAYHYLKTVFNKVEVQKGEVTANFRKMLGIQSVDEKKDRDKHSHHAIDATILTLIPTAAKRDKMLELFFSIQEKKRFGENTAELERELKKEIRNCGLSGNVSDIVPFIENSILVNHVSNDRTLMPAHKRKRVRGKIVPKKDENGKVLYETNEDGTIKKDKHGHPIPQAKEWITGDCIRGQLHKDSFFGAIKYPKKDGKGFPVKENHTYQYEIDGEGKEIITMVMRVKIADFKKESDISKIIDPYVRKSVEITIAKRKSENVSFDKAIKEPMWLLDKNGNEIKFDKNGRPLLPIRHIRCKVAAGRGFFTKDKAIEVKRQTYPSKHEYKNLYYAQNDGNYLCLLYEGVKKGKVERRFRFLNYFDMVSLGIKDVDAIKNEPYFQVIEEKNVTLSLTAIIKAGTRVLMWSDNPEELVGLDEKEISKRLFVVNKFNLKGANCIYLQNHIDARNEISSDEDYTFFDNTKYQARLTMVANSFNCLIENRDFVISDMGKINLL